MQQDNFYSICEQPDGRLRIRHGERDLDQLFNTEALAQRKLADLIQEFGGRGTDYVRKWVSDCPNCNAKKSVVIVKTSGKIVHLCETVLYKCDYERTIGPVPR